MNTYTLPNVQLAVLEAHYIHRIDPTLWDLSSIKSLENDSVEATYTYNAGDPLIPTTIRVGVYHKPNANDRSGGRTNISVKFTTKMIVVDEDDELVDQADHVTTIAWSGPYRAVFQGNGVVVAENLLSIVSGIEATPALYTPGTLVSTLHDKLKYGTAEFDIGSLPTLAVA